MPIPSLAASCGPLKTLSFPLSFKDPVSGLYRPQTIFIKVDLPAPWGAFLSIAQGGTDIACCGDAVSDELKAKVMAEREAIIAGKHVFAGPLKDRDGADRVASGEVLDDGALWGMDWFVSGVIGQ